MYPKRGQAQRQKSDGHAEGHAGRTDGWEVKAEAQYTTWLRMNGRGTVYVLQG